MEQKFGKNSIDLQVLREFCEREGEAVSYRKGDQMEREGNPSRWFGYVTDGCFKYVTHLFSARFCLKKVICLKMKYIQFPKRAFWDTPFRCEG